MGIKGPKKEKDRKKKRGIGREEVRGGRQIEKEKEREREREIEKERERGGGGEWKGRRKGEKTFISIPWQCWGLSFALKKKKITYCHGKLSKSRPRLSILDLNMKNSSPSLYRGNLQFTK